MKQFIDKLGKYQILPFIFILSLVVSFGACSDDNEEYFENTPLSILEDRREALVYLLEESIFGTAPGTYPESAKEILNKAIEELDAVIERVKGGQEIDSTTLETTVAKVNQAIDAFKETRLYNLSETALEYIRLLQEKAMELEEILNDESKFGNYKGQYPHDSKKILEDAIETLNDMAERILSGSIINITQELFDDAMLIADEAMQKFEATRLQEDNISWDLFVNGNNGGYIDFGYSPDYYVFGEEGDQSFTIEFWVKITNYYNVPGEDNSMMLCAYAEADGNRSGWQMYSRNNGGNQVVRLGMSRIDMNDGGSGLWEADFNYDGTHEWMHYAIRANDKGLDGERDKRAKLYRNGSYTGARLGIGEEHHAYNSRYCETYQVPMTAFRKTRVDGSYTEGLEGYIRNIRIWKTDKGEEYIRNSYLGSEEINPEDENLVCGWDLRVKEKPTETELKDIKGIYTATLKGDFEWHEAID
ncbi:MAG: DUF4972 domain-containing protein [Tannerellaceae bacterium]|nr:DUF4972 domain-containing protein [Tannerellaceae bacterium]